MRAALEARGVEVHSYDGSELSVKGDGGPTCLDLSAVAGGVVIARTWRGAVRYVGFAMRTPSTWRGPGVAGYRAVPGNRGVWMLRRDLDSG